MIIDEKFLADVVKSLHEQNYSAAQVGLHLKQKYFVKSKIKLTKLYPFLKDAEVQAENIKIDVERLKAHFEKNRKDFKAKRALVKKVIRSYHKSCYAAKRINKKQKC